MDVLNTPARKEIVSFLEKTYSPVDVERIIKFLRAKGLNTNKVTVYRTLNFLYDKGYVEKLEFGEGKFRYELKKNHHHHLICSKCGKIEDVRGEFLEKIEREIYKDKGFKVKNHYLEFFGLCSDCLLEDNNSWKQ